MRLGRRASAGWACAPTPTRPRTRSRAREFGAEGIGLCRTEHMFFDDDRLPVDARDDPGATRPAARRALDRLLPIQRADFEGIFRAMAGCPVTIRLLDPPLHEFLPVACDEIARRGRGRDRGWTRCRRDGRCTR